MGVGWTGNGDTLGLVGLGIDGESLATVGLEACIEPMAVATLAGAAVGLETDGEALELVDLDARRDTGSCWPGSRQRDTGRCPASRRLRTTGRSWSGQEANWLMLAPELTRG